MRRIDDSGGIRSAHLCRILALMIHRDQALLHSWDYPSIMCFSNRLLATHSVLSEVSRPTSKIIQSIVVHGEGVFLIGM